MSARDSLRNALGRLGLPGRLAIVAMVAAAAVLVVSARGIVSAVLVGAPRTEVAPGDDPHDQATKLASYVAQIDGRSLFIVPGAPPPPAPPPAPLPVAAKEEGPPPPPPPPSKYGGPAPIALIQDTVWFADGTRIKSGDQASREVKVVRASPPWSAVLLWKGVEFTVDLFERDQVVLKPPKLGVATPDPSTPATKPDGPAS